MRGHLALEIYFRARCLCVRENKLTRELLVYKDSFAIDTNRPFADVIVRTRSEEHTSELQSLL